LVDRLFFAEQARWTDVSVSGVPALDPSVDVTLADVQRQLHPNEAVLEYVLGETESFCLRINHSASTIVKLAPRKKIETHVNAYLTQLKAKKDSSSESQALFALLIQPLHLSAALTSIIIVPDGGLHLVPFSALEESSGAVIASDRAVSYLPSAGTLSLLRTRRRSEPPRMFLGVGGVEYSNKAQSIMLADAKPGLTRGDYYDVDFTRLPNLPGTEEEIRSAADILGAYDATLLVGRNGTETKFKSARLNQFRIVHLAVHGKANAKNPDRAALIFRPDPPEEDGLLEPREILGLHLNADLVVLSACETAVGHLQGEEGIANLARAFLIAGSESVISSLWPIDDTYSLFLMKRFYTHLRNGVSEAEALRLSETDLLDKFGKGTPAADWAAFTLLGDGDRVMLPENRTQVSSQ
jgi:CHAT domain-containing protein